MLCAVSAPTPGHPALSTIVSWRAGEGEGEVKKGGPPLAMPDIFYGRCLRKTLLRDHPVLGREWECLLVAPRTGE